MESPTLKRQLVTLFFALVILLPVGILYREFFDQTEEPSGVVIRRSDYRGWTNCILMANGRAEVVIVPAVGRVMQFRLKSGDGPFWENESMAGKFPDPGSADWGNFGGDKTWPAPQADWPRQTPRGWPPPRAFDSMPVEAVIDGSTVLLRSPVDPHYGIRTERILRLDPARARLTIATTFERVAGFEASVLTNWVGVWVITQLQDPLAVYVPVARSAQFPEGYALQSEAPPLDLKLDGTWLSLRRNPQSAHKVGTEAGSLLWIGERVVLRIDSPRQDGAVYPDQGSSAEVYTNPDPLPYVELEMLGPLRELKPGERMSQTNTYTLFRRELPTPADEAQRVSVPGEPPSR